MIPREALTDIKTIARIAGVNPRNAKVSHKSKKPERTTPQPGFHEKQSQKKSNPTRMVIVVVNGQQEPRQIEIGMSNFEQAEVLSGLVEGDTVLTTVTSKALRDREAFLERVRGWNQLPGMKKNTKK